MQDRISNHPNRWVLTPVTGQANTYDFTRADDPTQVGTPLNKATFLPDAVASAIESATGVSGVTLPGEALDAIATYLNNIGATNNIVKMETGSYVGAGGTTQTDSVSLTFSFKPRFLLLLKSGEYVNITQQGNCTAWMYPATLMHNSNTVTYDNDKTLSWVNTTTTQSNRPSYRMDVSGTTYYYLALGVE